MGAAGAPPLSSDSPPASRPPQRRLERGVHLHPRTCHVDTVGTDARSTLVDALDPRSLPAQETTERRGEVGIVGVPGEVGVAHTLLAAKGGQLFVAILGRPEAVTARLEPPKRLALGAPGPEELALCELLLRARGPARRPGQAGAKRRGRPRHPLFRLLPSRLGSGQVLLG